MFSYRHAFHVGNHADVLKHMIWIELIQYHQIKDKGIYFIDTHAGAGVYHLDDPWCQQKREFNHGFKALEHFYKTSKTPSPKLIQQYLGLIHHLQEKEPTQYPGSPWITLSLIRPQDRLRLFEWHPSEIEVLKENIATRSHQQQKQVQVFHENGFKRLYALLPPPSRRSVTLIDPSYEDKKDYVQMIHMMQAALKRFPTGCYAIWYPITQEQPWDDMTQKLKDFNLPYIDTQLYVNNIEGLSASGMLIINPPYTLAEQLQETLPYLSQALNNGNQQCFNLDILNK